MAPIKLFGYLEGAVWESLKAIIKTNACFTVNEGLYLDYTASFQEVVNALRKPLYAGKARAVFALL